VNTDVLVIGGGAAGPTAAPVLARARHRVTLIDDQTYRNATVDEFHGFPTRDATAPHRFRADAVRELTSYGVAFVASTVTRVDATDRIVRVALDDGTTIAASAMLLATGVQDDLSPIDGLAQRWGKSVFNCPFCDGWEQRDQSAVVIDAAPGAEHLVGMLRSWTPNVTIVDAGDVAALTGHGATLDQVVLSDGNTIVATAAFLKAPVIREAHWPNTLAAKSTPPATSSPATAAQRATHSCGLPEMSADHHRHRIKWCSPQQTAPPPPSPFTRPSSPRAATPARPGDGVPGGHAGNGPGSHP